VGDAAVKGEADVTTTALGSDLAASLGPLVGAIDEAEQAARPNENTTADRCRDVRRFI
jgi:hypothetical protein